MSTTQRAAFFRVEGILVKPSVVRAAAYMAANRSGFRERALHLTQAALSAPVFAVLGQNDRTLGNRVAHLALRDMSEDRIVLLAEEYAEDVLAHRVYEAGLELVRKHRAEGAHIVLISETVGHIMRPLLAKLRITDELVCNELEFRGGHASGKLLDPVVGGYEGGKWLRDYCRAHGVDPARSAAFGSHGPDVLLLAGVGHPCAVNPDMTLRKAAREADWPVIDFRA
jgi:phosphoserine phosphatase